MIATDQEEEVSQFHARQWSSATAHDMLHDVTLLAWLAYCRSRVGEFMHAQQHLGSAVDELLRMFRRCGAGEGFRRISDASPRRRLHAVQPEMAQELLGILLGTVDAPEVRLLDLAERHLRAATPELRWDDLFEVRSRMRAEATYRPVQARL